MRNRHTTGCGRRDEIAAWNEREGPYRLYEGDASLGIITTGIGAVHAREAAPQARTLVLGMTYPLAMQRIRDFAASVDRLVVIEEGDPVLQGSLRVGRQVIVGFPNFAYYTSRVQIFFHGRTPVSPSLPARARIRPPPAGT